MNATVEATTVIETSCHTTGWCREVVRRWFEKIWPWCEIIPDSPSFWIVADQNLALVHIEFDYGEVVMHHADEHTLYCEALRLLLKPGFLEKKAPF